MIMNKYIIKICFITNNESNVIYLISTLNINSFYRSLVKLDIF
jgi:hypothetical protein